MSNLNTPTEERLKEQQSALLDQKSLLNAQIEELEAALALVNLELAETTQAIQELIEIREAAYEKEIARAKYEAQLKKLTEEQRARMLNHDERKILNRMLADGSFDFRHDQRQFHALIRRLVSVQTYHAVLAPHQFTETNVARKINQRLRDNDAFDLRVVSSKTRDATARLLLTDESLVGNDTLKAQYGWLSTATIRDVLMREGEDRYLRKYYITS